MHKMLLERRNITASMESDKSRLIEAHPATGSQDLRSTNPGHRFYRVAAGTFNPLEELKPGKVDVSHKHDDAFSTLMVQRSDRLQSGYLVLVAHGDNPAFSPDERPDQVNHRRETGYYVGRFDQFSATLG